MRARVIAICEVVAEVTHLAPYNRYAPAPPSASGSATVDVVETSEPPARSVIHCPDVQKRAGSRDVSRSDASRVRASPCSSRNRAAPSVIASGQLYVADEGWKR